GWLQFRRDQVTSFVRELYVTVNSLKPAVKFSAATIAWGNGPTSGAAWLNAAPYASVLQDWKAWLEEGILDMNVPMDYFDNLLYPTYWTNWTNFDKSHKNGRH